MKKLSQLTVLREIRRRKWVVEMEEDNFRFWPPCKSSAFGGCLSGWSIGENIVGLKFAGGRLHHPECYTENVHIESYYQWPTSKKLLTQMLNQIEFLVKELIEGNAFEMESTGKYDDILNILKTLLDNSIKLCYGDFTSCTEIILGREKLNV